MALNLATLKTRSLTAAVFVLVMMTGLLWNQWSFFVLFSVIHFGCWVEYRRLLCRIDPVYEQATVLHQYAVMVLGWAFMMYCSKGIFNIAGISLHDIGIWLGVAMLVVLVFSELLTQGKSNPRIWSYSALGLLYISLSWGLLTSLRCMFYGSLLDFIDKLLVLMIVGSIWINDTMAYIVGSLIGKHPLTPISPKKTWEGTVGGILLAVLVMGLIGYLVGSEFDWGAILQWMAIAAIASVAGTFGDLLESKLKRMVDVKDSGQLMPGHGGFLDRFDSMLLATPFVWLYVVIFIK